MNQNTDEHLVKKFLEKIHGVFGHKFKYCRKGPNLGSKDFYRADISIKAIVRFFNKFFEIPLGRKSHCIKVPNVIKDSPKDLQLAFLEGIFDTDGGRRQGGFGLTSASKAFRDDTAELLSNFTEKVSKDEWLNRKYNKKYYGLRFSKKGHNLPFLHGYPSPVKGDRFRR